jgi:transposase
MSPPKKRKMWHEDKMHEAVEAVIRKEMGYLKASKHFAVPQTTLERYVKRRRESGTGECKTQLGRKPVFPPNLEAELVQHCLLMEERFFGITRADLRRLAYRLASANNMPNTFSAKSESAGKKWLKGFLKRHRETLTVRMPQGISAARVKSFTKENVNKFFDLLEPEL